MEIVNLLFLSSLDSSLPLSLSHLLYISTLLLFDTCSPETSSVRP